MAVLFFLKLADGVIFVVEGALMILLIALTLSAQLLLRRSFLRTSTLFFEFTTLLMSLVFAAITSFLPMSLATRKLQEKWERELKKHHELEDASDGEDEMDLFSRDRECCFDRYSLGRRLTPGQACSLSCITGYAIP